ncbi:hypothetical protein AQUCO_00100211v1 [Aquilegia coerulea]|uniref:NAC domain-containing protein n=1 Tax=Aquilegia coerulea TaxID=218851 RepID=A0A2G5F9G5_AQUCA|nr:hypothetical protein AQUCO_00100211v1 [Aquilegia coerulea]
MNKNQSSSDLIDAKLEEHQLCGSKQCPGCGHKLERKPDWLGLPAGVKFDPTDQELIEHLEAKVEAGQDSKSHPLIDEFIPTIEGEDGICYTHPERLPGVTRDGLSKHFFHRPSKAYTTGTRKRRKIQTECDLQTGETRWHKTGKTRPVMVNGRQKGCKKILVLYTNFGKNRKPEKTNWVMHQYHLGQLEEEKEGELVVSKIFYQTQPRQCNWSDRGLNVIGEGSAERISSRRDSGSGSCSSSKDVSTVRDDLSTVVSASTAGPGMSISSYPTIDIQQMKADHFSFVPFRKSFDEVGVDEPRRGRDASNHSCQQENEEHEHQMQHHVSHEVQQQQQPPPQQHHHHHQVTTAAYQITRPLHPISTIIPPPPLNHTSIVPYEDPYNISRILLQNDKFQQQQQQQQHHQVQQQHQLQQQQQQHKLVGRSGSGLEELLMGCTSTDIKDVSYKSFFDTEIYESYVSLNQLD